MATKRSKSYLTEKFEDGDRPTGENFADLIESFINSVDDGVTFDADGNLLVPAGVKISGATNGTDGTVRFNNVSGQIEVFFGGTWNPIGGGDVVFEEVAGGPQVAFNGGNVGIGTGNSATYKFNVVLAALAGEETRARLGNLVAHNGASNNDAHICHHSKTGPQDFALKHSSNGNTTLNASTNAQLFISQGGTNRIIIDAGGNLGIGAPTTIQGNLTVTGNVTTNGNFIDTSPSDALVKQDVRTLPFGLDELLKLKPVSFKYNGMGGTPTDGKERVGLIAQEVEKIFPSLVRKIKTSDPAAEEILGYDSQPLLFIMINAIRELTQRVEKLEAQLSKV